MTQEIATPVHKSPAEILMPVMEFFSDIIVDNPTNKNAKELYDIWIESIPPDPSYFLPPHTAVNLQISTSGSMQKVSFSAIGPEQACIARFVDFFWTSGATEKEIERLHDVGSYFNPLTIGWWIDLSKTGGLDGGWLFLKDITVSEAVEVADFGHASRSVLEWAAENKITHCPGVARDMGASPPNQTEIEMKLHGSFIDQVHVALKAFEYFGFPSVPPGARKFFQEAKLIDPTQPLRVSFLVTREGCIRVSAILPEPDSRTVENLLALAPGAWDNRQEKFEKLEEIIGAKGPNCIEYSYLAEGFGYSAYQEGFDVICHYNIS